MISVPTGGGFVEQNMLDVVAELNRVYRRLELKGIQMLNGLHHRIFEPKLSYYSGHYRRLEDGSFAVDDFPIPVVEVKGCCDVEINLDCVTVTAKLRWTDALVRSYEKLMKYEFEAYGEEDYTSDYYHSGMTISTLKDNIRNSDEKEIGFSFWFDFDVAGDTMYEFVKLLRREGVYY